MLLWLKLKFISLVGWFGIDWSQVSEGDKLNVLIATALSVVGLLVSAATAWDALEQRWAAQREARRRAVLKVVLPNPPTNSGRKPDRYQLYIQNEGDKAGSGFWYLGIPKRIRERVTVMPSSGNEEIAFPADNWDIYSDFDKPLVSHFSDDYYLLKFMMTHPVDPGVMMPCATVSVEWNLDEDEWMGQKSSEYKNQARRIFGWFTKGPSGRVPETGMMKLRMYSRVDSAFKNYHGGIELPEDDPEEFR